MTPFLMFFHFWLSDQFMLKSEHGSKINFIWTHFNTYSLSYSIVFQSLDYHSSLNLLELQRDLYFSMHVKSKKLSEYVFINMMRSKMKVTLEREGISHNIPKNLYQTSAVKMSIQVLPGDWEPPRVSRKPEGSILAFSMTDKADRISSFATFLVFAAFLSTLTLSLTSLTNK